MAAAAGAIGVNLGVEAAKGAESVVKSILEWMEHPIYQDTKTVTRSWAEVDKNGKTHYLSETKTTGWAISNGMVVGTVALVALWEMALGFARALNSAASSAENILAQPLVVAMDLDNRIVGFASTLGGDISNAWNWLDGKGASHSSPPPTAAKTIQQPATAMAALSQTMISGLVPINDVAGSFAAKVSAWVQNPPP